MPQESLSAYDDNNGGVGAAIVIHSVGLHRRFIKNEGDARVPHRVNPEHIRTESAFAWPIMHSVWNTQGGSGGVLYVAHQSCNSIAIV